ncbi:MAG: zinc ribbon domain-containing protein [Oscillospiraceae bacterium]|nr:zinc ribbon domain-containing protein [Oscillospiraceae bacterium]
MVMHNSDFGRNADGSVNSDYCRHCFIDGKFGKDETMDEMIESCIPFYVGEEFETVEEARKYLQKLYPTLSRWKK